MKLVTLDADVFWGLPKEFLELREVSRDCLEMVRQTLRDAAPTKLLQTEYRFSALVRLGERFILFSFFAGDSDSGNGEDDRGCVLRVSHEIRGSIPT